MRGRAVGSREEADVERDSRKHAAAGACELGRRIRRSQQSRLHWRSFPCLSLRVLITLYTAQLKAIATSKVGLGSVRREIRADGAIGSDLRRPVGDVGAALLVPAVLEEEEASSAYGHIVTVCDLCGKCGAVPDNRMSATDQDCSVCVQDMQRYPAYPCHIPGLCKCLEPQPLAAVNAQEEDESSRSSGSIGSSHRLPHYRDSSSSSSSSSARRSPSSATVATGSHVNHTVAGASKTVNATDFHGIQRNKEAATPFEGQQAAASSSSATTTSQSTGNSMLSTPATTMPTTTEKKNQWAVMSASRVESTPRTHSLSDELRRDKAILKHVTQAEEREIVKVVENITNDVSPLPTSKPPADSEGVSIESSSEETESSADSSIMSSSREKGSVPCGITSVSSTPNRSSSSVAVADPDNDGEVLPPIIPE